MGLTTLTQTQTASRVTVARRQAVRGFLSQFLAPRRKGRAASLLPALGRGPCLGVERWGGCSVVSSAEAWAP